MRNLSEKELVVLAQEGNNRAMSVLLERMRPKALNSMRIKFIGTSPETIEDAVQVSLMKSFTKLGKYNPTYSFSTWFFRICINTIIDGKRKVENKVTFLSTDASYGNNEAEDDMPTLGSMISSNELNPEEKMQNDERKEFAIKILSSKKISVPILEVANMRYLQELSYDEIVEKTGNPLGTVKARLHRFRKVVEETTPNKIKVASY